MAGIILVRKSGISGDVRDLGHRDRTLDSTVNQLKVFMSGSGTVHLVKDEQYYDDKEIIDIEHNLGYQPFFAGWFRQSGTTLWTKIPSMIDIDINGTPEHFVGAMGRPSDNIIQLHFYTMSIFGPMYDVYLDYHYLIYVDPYRDAW